jgi:hypothetical protein
MVEIGGKCKTTMIPVMTLDEVDKNDWSEVTKMISIEDTAMGRKEDMKMIRKDDG